LQALARKGAIELLPGASRGLRLKDIPGQPVQGALPLVGRVAAGHPILAVENIESHYRIDPALFSPRADYLLRVRGESMRDAGILDGDLLAVHRTREARNGQIVVARVGAAGGDEVTVKRFRKRGREIVLLPENPAFSPIVVDPRATSFAIEGLGVGLVRNGNG
jgi:repressor LexA